MFMAKRKLDPIHPGEVLMEEFLKPMKLSQNRLALALGVPARRINEIVLGKRGVSADSALRLSQYFGNSAQFWLGLQMEYDLDVTRLDSGSTIEKEVRRA
jgi:addiction module HigA family antidote